MEQKIQNLTDGLIRLNARLVALEKNDNAESDVEMSADIADLITAMVKAQAEMDTAGKSASGYNFKYADWQECIESSRPALTKHGLAVLQPPHSSNSDYIYTILAHTSGQYIKSRTKIKPDKEGNQGYGAALTYVKRYAYCSMIGLAIANENDIDKYNK
ncbi:MAG: ERF family protein [Nitrosopumilaceae archaeon]|nr:ERF family protein [Nitrosopumilaceae archaeon]